jgi:hypothetical protein
MGQRFDPAAPILGWGDDRQKETVVMMLLVVSTLCLAIVLAVRWVDGWVDAPPLPRCAAEDMVVVQMAEPAFDFADNALVCVHVDAISYPEEP